MSNIMTNTELKALRQIFFLECSEAAEHVGVSVRTWQYWEAGRMQVPVNVSDLMLNFAGVRENLLEQRYSEFKSTGDIIRLDFCMTIDDFEILSGKRNVVLWKITNSVAAECLSAGIATIKE